jgi:hypothetical protein
VWAYDNPKIATYSKEGSMGVGDNAFPLNIKSFVYSNYAYDNQNNRYNSQSFSNKTFNVFALSGIYLFDSTTIGDPASAIAFIITDTGNVGIGLEDPAEKLTVVGNISARDTVIADSLSARFLGLVHNPPNDSINPTVRIGETDASGFSGVFISYIETTNTFGISSLFSPAPAVGAIAIDRFGNVGVNTNDPKEKLTISGNISANGDLILRNNYINGPLSRIVGNTSNAENVSIVMGNNSHSEGFYSGVIGDGSHAEGTANYVGLRCNFVTYTAATRTLTFLSSVSSRINDYTTAVAGTSAILYITTPARFEPVQIESRDLSTGSIVLTKDVVGSNVSSSIRFLILPPTNVAAYSHAEGYYAEATGPYSHAEGYDCWSHGEASHSEGYNTFAEGSHSHAEGDNTSALGAHSHAEGYRAIAKGIDSHAAGVYSNALYDRSWIWHGSSNTTSVSTTKTDQFLVSAAGGVYFPGNVGIGTDINLEKLTVVGNISATDTVITNAISSRYINLIHSPANDDNYPYLRVGETDTDGFSGFNITYNENNNKIITSSSFGTTTLTATTIDRFCNIEQPNGFYVTSVSQVSAAGTNQTTASAIFTTVTTVTGADTSVGGLLLPQTNGGHLLYVYNFGANSINVYPQVGGRISGYAVNAPYVMAIKNSAIFQSLSSNFWVGVRSL